MALKRPRLSTSTPAATSSSACTPMIVDQPTRQPRARHGAGRRAEGDQREQPLARGRRIHVVGVSPELCGDHQAEHADPQEEHHADDDAALGQHVENRQAGDEQRRHGVDQPPSWQSSGHGAVERHQHDEEHGLRGVGITLDFGAAGLGQDQHLAHRLHHVVRHQDQEDIERQRQQSWPFALAHVAEQPQRPLQRPAGQRRFGRQVEDAGGGGGIGCGHRFRRACDPRASRTIVA